MTNADEKQTPKAQWSLARVLPLLILIAGLVAFFYFGLQKYVTFAALKENREVLTTWVQAHGVEAVVAFIALYAVAVAFSLPIAALLTIAGGFLFGTMFGTLWTVTGATIGATVAFLAAKTALGDPLRARFGARLKAMEAGFRANAFSYMLVLRLVPLFPFWLVNLAPAFLGVGLSTYVIATFIGIIPGSFVYTSIGTGLNALIDAGQQPDLRMILKPEFLIPILGLALLAMIPVVYRLFTPKKAQS